MIRRITLNGFFALILCSLGQTAFAAANNKHVVIVVWDGMRPDFVTEQNTPTLLKLGKQGVIFGNHHAVYLSATNVNGTALVTGDYPEHTGIIANREFRPAINAQKPVDVEAVETVEKGDALTNGKYVSAPTLAELIAQTGGRTIVASSKTIGFLLARQDANVATKGNVTLSDGRAWPNESLTPIVATLGEFPKSHLDKDKWTTRALTEVLWKDGVPSLSILWLGEPDLTQHETAPGAPAAIAAIKSSDDNLAAVLAALDRLHMRDNTDIIVVSDHGFSTIKTAFDVPKILRDAGFNAVIENPQPNDIMVVGVGGSVLFYVPQHNPALTQRVVDFLQQSNFARVIFTKKALEGTFALNQAMIDSAEAPDIVMSFGWRDLKNQFGVSGMIDADWQRAAGKGTHASLSLYDMHNTLIVAGPDFHHGLTTGYDLHSGNTDIAPTVLHILGIPAPKMDGRVLTEAMVPTDIHSLPVMIYKASKKFPTGAWRQILATWSEGSTTYLDWGDGEFRPNGH